MKYLMIICDGMPDEGATTPLSQAYHPGLDFLAINGKTGTMDLKYEIVDSDIGFLKLLGCYEDYPGRGYLEALAAGIECDENDVFIRANFATLGSDGLMKDRRAGRDETGLDELSKKINGIEVDGIRFVVKRTLGHRMVVVMKSLDGKRLSDQIIGNDTKAVGVHVRQIKAKKPNAKRTAAALNKFVYKTNKILSEHRINEERKIQANFIIIRNAGHKTETPSFQQRYGMSACCIAAHPVMEGVAKFLKMDFIKPEGANGLENTNLGSKLAATLEMMKMHDFVLLHVNGFDQMSHDRDPERKMRFIEKFDSSIVKKLLEKINLNDVVIIVTSDHASASSPGYKGYEHLKDPVPVVVCGDGVRTDGSKRFDEMSARGGSLRINDTGLLETVFRLASQPAKK